MASVDDVTSQLAGAKVSPKFELSFKGQGLKLDKAEDAKDIVAQIERCDHMTALRLEGNTMGVEAAEVIAKAIGKHPEFERALWSDMFTGRLKSEIPHALEHLGASIMSANCQLAEIDLSDNAFGPNGIVGLVELLKSPSCFSLQELKLNNNGLGITGGKMLAECLMDCYKASVSAGRPLALKTFISGRGRLENEGAIALSEVFKNIGTLEYLAMPQNGINFPGISALAGAIAANPRLKHLNLNDNTFTSRGAEAIAKALPKLTQLEVMNFGDCLVRTDGARAIVKVIGSGLKELILSGNEINKSGGVEVAEALEGKNSLVKVDLNANGFGEEGCEEVRAVMQAIGLEDALASLSDDEGSDDEDDDEEGDGDDDYGEDEEPEEESEGDVIDDPKLQVKGQSMTPSKPAISVKDFLAFPSPSKLAQLGSNSGDGLVKELGSDTADVDKVVSMILKVSLVVSKDDEAKEKACLCIDGLLQNLFKSNSEVSGTQVANALLVGLGLLKGEDKKFKAPGSIVGPLLVLEHAVKKSYFPPDARTMMQAFISKPHALLEKASDARHKILQTLYAF